MGEHDCETIARAHLVSLRWASGPSSLRAEPPRHRLRRIALRATGHRLRHFSVVSSCIARRSPKAMPGRLGAKRRGGREAPHLTGTISASARWLRIVLADLDPRAPFDDRDGRVREDAPRLEPRVAQQRVQLLEA